MHADRQTDAPGTWLLLHEAATALGCSVDTVRRKARSGELISRQVPRPGGFTWQILMPSPTQDAEVPTAAVGELIALVRDLTARNDQLADQNTQLAGQLGFKEAQLQAANEKILQLEAPVVTVERNGMERAPQRPWWAFWRPRPVAG